jgi:hypothetical protein
MDVTGAFAGAPWGIRDRIDAAATERMAPTEARRRESAPGDRAVTVDGFGRVRGAGRPEATAPSNERREQ